MGYFFIDGVKVKLVIMFRVFFENCVDSCEVNYLVMYIIFKVESSK